MAVVIPRTGAAGADAKREPLSENAIRARCAAEIGQWNLRGRRVLAIVPDHTRTAPIDVMFRILHDLLIADVKAFDVLVALGTHPPLTDDAIDARLGLTRGDRETTYARTKFMNHDWTNPDQLALIGEIGEDEVALISGGRMRERVKVTINKIALEYDLLLIIGPTFPHEVVGFSGGNKYLFPGISGREIIDMFHWLGALITNMDVIGAKSTPVRRIVDRAASMVPVERKCVSLVVEDEGLVGLYIGTPEEAWGAAADLSSRVHVCYEDRAFRSVLSCAPPMYDELWVGGKCAYKLEPVVADGGELIIYAPHIARISATHGETIRRIGYHVRDYFVRQMDRFAGISRGVMAHSTHVKGVGTYANGVERPRIEVVLATQISEAECRAVNLGYRDFRSINVADWQERRDEGRLLVPRAGELLFRLKSSRRAADESRPDLGAA
ncbi:MAG TPA: lactate racemase domain-containing protein [Polyangiaceae bacterium]|nr:lactate racemase domain-containing protein [Polyangiaceae bacterium]